MSHENWLISATIQFEGQINNRKKYFFFSISCHLRLLCHTTVDEIYRLRPLSANLNNLQIQANLYNKSQWTTRYLIPKCYELDKCEQHMVAKWVDVTCSEPQIIVEQDRLLWSVPNPVPLGPVTFGLPGTHLIWLSNLFIGKVLELKNCVS